MATTTGISPRKTRDLSVGRVIWNALMNVRALPALVVSIVLAVVLAKYVETVVPLWIVSLAGVIALIIVSALVEALVQVVAIARAPRTLSVVECCRPSGPFKGAHALLVLHAADGLPSNAAIAVYRVKGPLHEHVGFGTVRDQQDAETFQVTLDMIYPDISVDSLFDRNETPLAALRARVEVSLGRSETIQATATKAQGEQQIRPAIPNPAIPELAPEASVVRAEVEK